MSWASLFGKKDEEYEEFLLDPKVLYQKIKINVEEIVVERDALKAELKTAQKTFADTLEAKQMDWAAEEEVLRTDLDDLHEERDDLIVERDSLKTSVASLTDSSETYRVKYLDDINVEKRRLSEEHNRYNSELEKKWLNDYEVSIAKKNAELEKNYNHEVHTFIENQNDKLLETIPHVVRETIIGFHNEVANSKTV